MCEAPAPASTSGAEYATVGPEPRISRAIAASSAEFTFLSKSASALGAWRLPPPVGGLALAVAGKRADVRLAPDAGRGGAVVEADEAAAAESTSSSGSDSSSESSEEGESDEPEPELPPCCWVCHERELGEDAELPVPTGCECSGGSTGHAHVACLVKAAQEKEQG